MAQPPVYAELSLPPCWVSPAHSANANLNPTIVLVKSPSHGFSANKSDLQLVQKQVYLLAQSGFCAGLLK